MVGVAYDGGSRFPGCRAAPGAVLSWLNDRQPKTLREIKPLCSIPVVNQGSEAALTLVREYTANVLRNDANLLLLGGDHSISAAAVDALSSVAGAIDVLVFDAHHDLGELSVLRNWNVIRHIGAVAEQVLVVGTRDDIRELGAVPTNIRSIPVDRLEDPETNEALAGLCREAADRPLYISIDLDVLDPSVFPGVSYPEPGGLTFREFKTLLSYILARRKPAVVDLMEFNPLVSAEPSAAVIGSVLRLIDQEWAGGE